MSEVEAKGGWISAVVWGGAAVAVVGGVAFGIWHFSRTQKEVKRKHLKVVINAVDNSLTEEFKDALSSIFKEEDKDQDGILNDEELDHLLLRVQGKHLDENLKQFIAATFDTDDQGHLTLQGWIESYQWMLHNLDDEAQAEAAIKRDLKVFDWTYDHFKA